VLTALCIRGYSAIPERLWKPTHDHLNADLWRNGRVLAAARRA
jgi:hypothetical protein